MLLARTRVNGGFKSVTGVALFVAAILHARSMGFIWVHTKVCDLANKAVLAVEGERVELLGDGLALVGRIAEVANCLGSVL